MKQALAFLNMLTRVGWTLKRVSVYSYAKKVIGLPQVPKIISNALSNASNRKHTVKCIKYATFILVKQAANIFDCQLKRIMRLTKANNIRKKITEFIRSWLNGIDNKKYECYCSLALFFFIQIDACGALSYIRCIWICNQVYRAHKK